MLRSATRLSALAAGLLLSAVAARADYDASTGPPVELLVSPDFEPPAPEEGFDWIRLTSSEWLKGDLDGMRSFELSFDSDELDDLVFDFEDVDAIVTTRMHTLVFEADPDPIVVTGTLAMRGDVIRIRQGGEVLSFPRSLLISIVPGQQTERDFWSGDFSLGLTARSGNTNQSDLSGLARLKREDAFTRSTLEYNGAFGRLEGDTNVNNHRANLKVDYFAWKRTYLIPIWLEGYKDELQNLSYRITPAVGVGHHLVKDPRLQWDLEAAVGYQYIEYTQAPPGESRSSGEVAGIIGTQWESDITKNLEFDGEYRLQQSFARIQDTTHHFLTTLSQDLLWNLDLDVTFVWDRNESPQQESDGSRPERNDFRLTVGLGWDF